jgi:hypothetical protein
MSLDAENTNPMLSGASQRAVVERLRALGVRGPELVTTTYNHAGVIEAWTDEAIRPAHAWPMLAVGDDACRLRDGWRAILRTYRPRYLLLTDGENMFESGSTDYRAIARELDTVAAADDIHLSYERFPTEAHTPGWALVTVDDAQARPGEVADACRTCAPRVSSFGAARVGDRIGTCWIEQIRSLPHRGGAVVAVGCQLGGHAHLDVRPVESGRDAPGRAGDWGVYYRNEDLASVPREDLVAVAYALGERIGVATP